MADRTDAPDEEPVGSVGEEAIKLFRALAADALPGSSEAHACPNGWCPVCRVASFVQDNPEAVAAMTSSALAFAKSVKDVLDGVIAAAEPQRDDEATS